MSVQFAHASSQGLTAPRGRHMGGGSLFARLGLFGKRSLQPLGRAALFTLQAIGLMALMSVTTLPIWFFTP